jgi:hypothetical protein
MTRKPIRIQLSRRKIVVRIAARIAALLRAPWANAPDRAG